MAYANLQDPRNLAAKRKHYYANKEQYIERNKIKKQQLQAYLRSAKDVPCVDCKVRYPYYVMQFDHIENDKEYGVASLVGRGSLEKLKREIAKCEVVCANCHMERTHARLITGL